MQEDSFLELLLRNRSIDSDSFSSFISSSYDSDLHDPFLLKDMEKSVLRIYKAISNKEKILIYSDYDCDGIPSAVIMHDFFTKIGYNNFSIYIPHRHDEGYGLHIEAVDQFIKDKVNLIITFDLGITAIDQVLHASNHGIDVIVTDHHLPHRQNEKDILPCAFAIINPKQEDCLYPYKMLCGAGVGFKLICALVEKHGDEWGIQKGWEKWLLDMVGLATLSDQVPLTGENRVFASYGLRVFPKTKRLGLLEIFKKAKVSISNINEEDVTFTLAPRLNACSRMETPTLAFSVLSTTDMAEARSLSDYIDSINNVRKKTVASIMKDVKKHLDKKFEDKEQDIPVIVIGNPLWRVGVLGLVASKIVEEYKRPAFVWGQEGGEIIRGSCRSFGNINIVEIMSSLPKESMITFGGHKEAGGFSVEHEQIHFLEERLFKVCSLEKKEEQEQSESFFVDTELSLDDVDAKHYSVIEKLAPFGTGNQKPIFLFKNSIIHEIKEFGKEKNHLEIIFLNSKKRPIKSIAFFKTRNDYSTLLEVGTQIDLIASFEKSTFLGRTELRLRIVDIK